MATSVRTVISNPLIIRALNTPGGSGGAYKEMERIRRSTLAIARGIAPLGNPENAMHRGGLVGTYKASFKSDKRGSSGHYLIRRMYNTADHAYYVEHGRGSTKFTLGLREYMRQRNWIARTGGVPRRWERYSSTFSGGVIITSPGTSGWEGFHTMEISFDEAMRRSKVHVGISGRFAR